MLRELSGKVINGLSREPKTLAYTLLGKGLLSQEKVEEIVQIPATDMQRARTIYNVILRDVEHFPQRYKDFKSIFEENPHLYDDLLQELKRKEAEIGTNIVLACSITVSIILTGWYAMREFLYYRLSMSRSDSF